MMPNISPAMRLCDCRCPVHHGLQRATYDDDGCACAITCSTQPTTLLAEPWSCALFLDLRTDCLWTVPQFEGGQWDWESASPIDSRSEFAAAGVAIEQKLREIAEDLHDAVQ